MQYTRRNLISILFKSENQVIILDYLYKCLLCGFFNLIFLFRFFRNQPLTQINNSFVCIAIKYDTFNLLSFLILFVWLCLLLVADEPC